ncbi:MAG: Uma2 family endonuclease, partial [Chloroflexota bacterium]
MTDAVRSMTAEEYFELPETIQIDELIDGEYIVSPPPTITHQYVVGNGYIFLRTSAAHGRTVLSPAAIRFEVDHVLEPDLFWIRPDGECKPVKNHYWEGAPDLVIEVLSPSTAKRDRGVKFDVYERHGVREYWLIDLDAQFVEVYRHEAGALKRQGIYESKEKFVSGAPGIEAGNFTGFHCANPSSNY